MPVFDETFSAAPLSGLRKLLESWRKYACEVQADKAKLLAVRQAEEAQAAAAQAAADQQQQEAEAEERKVRERSQLMERKTARLPAEPSANESVAITVAVRVPSGQRISRR